MIRVAGIVLAAGASTRLGEPKQLVTLAGETLLGRAARIAWEAGCSPVVVVLGAGADAVREGCSLGLARVVVNEEWQAGMASSIRVGVGAVAGEVEGVILMTCDQPAVSAKHLRQLAGRKADEVTGSTYGGRRGVPGYFPASSFPELMGLRGDQGARRVLASAASIELSGGEVDVDTPESLERARVLYGNGSG